MTDKEKIIVEIERQKKHLNTNYLDENGALIAYNHIIDYINSMPEEPVSEDLEETAHTYAANNGGRWLTDDIGIKIFAFNPQEVKDAFKAGAQWQKKQMMSKAIDALVHTFDNGYIRVGTQLLANNKYGLKAGDKVKVILIKDE